MPRTYPFAALGLVLSTGCATIAHGPSQNVTIVSDPPGATVTVLSKQTVKATPGVTPVVVKLARRDPNLTVRLEKDGCAPAEVRLTRKTSGWVMGNLIAANPLAMQGYDHDPGGQYAMQVGVVMPLMFGLDFASGAAYKLPKAVDVRLCQK